MKKFILLFSLFFSIAQSAFSEQLGVYFVVDRALVSSFEDNDYWIEFIDQMVLESNEIYTDSKVDIQLRVADFSFRTFSFTDPTQLLANIQQESGAFSGLLALADRVGADYIVTLTELAPYELCGKAVDVNRNLQSISKTKKSIALSDPDCGQDTLVHEIGHLMGLAHGSQVATARNNSGHNNGLTSYSKGWGRIVSLMNADDDYTNETFETGEYGTLMVGNHVAYWTGFANHNNKLPLFSSPTVYTNAMCAGPCGRAGQADSVRALNEFKSIYASHEEADVDFLTYSDSNLAGCIRDYHQGQEIVDVVSLRCVQSDIGSIGGLEQLTSAKNIDLSNNRIGVVYYLETLLAGNLQSVNLYGNDTAICEQLNSLEAKYPGKIIRPSRCLNLGALMAALTVI
ncbi:reprolysin-like metallopeptidase [Reinekea sp. G2M2-21]|uniref:reprolysin-like metallopeptidase n=1 Tax=Reinekea sp. G2M2-21 TaxID=2788942 RepID=UPI0018A9076B|nr:M12 family metallo-peptidase [Reinekea sp. G2M2-21]